MLSLLKILKLGYITFILFLLSLSIILYSQTKFYSDVTIIKNEYPINYKDSSLYTIFTIDDNVCFAGKYGILKCYNKSTNQKDNQYSWITRHIQGKTILKSIYNPTNSILYLFSNDGTIFKINTLTQYVTIKKFSNLTKKAIYYAELINNTHIVLCGGNKKVSMGKIALPKGYLAIVDTGLSQVKYLKKHPTRFVWSFDKISDSSIVYTSFNLLTSKIVRYNVYTQKMERKINIKGLIYRVFNLDNNRLLFIGSKNFQYFKHAQIGIVSNFKYITKHILKNRGCIWDLRSNNINSYVSTQDGKVLVYNKQDLNNACFDKYELIDTHITLPIYEELLLDNRLYLSFSKNIIGLINLNLLSP